MAVQTDKRNSTLPCNSPSDAFERLPDGVIAVDVFGRIEDAKCLFNCSLVSKRFASLVFQSRHRHIFISVNREAELTWYPRYNNNKKDVPDGALSTRNVSNDLYSLQKNFLSRFSSIQSLHIHEELIHQGGTNNHDVRRHWILRCNLDCQSCKSSTLSILIGSPAEDYLNTRYSNICAMSLVLEDLRFKVTELEELARHFCPPDLQELSISDSSHQGRAVMRRRMLLDPCQPSLNGGTVRIWSMNVLKLPVSDRVIRDVKLYIVKGPESADDDELIVKEAFEEEFLEAAMEVMKSGTESMFPPTVEDDDGDERNTG